MMTNNGGYQSNYSSGQGGYFNQSPTYTPPPPNNYPPQYPPQQYPSQQNYNSYGNSNIYGQPPPNPYLNQGYPSQTPPPPNPYLNQVYPPQTPPPPNPYLNQPLPTQAPPYGYSNNYPSPQYPNYPPQAPVPPVPPAPYGNANAYMPPQPIVPVPVARPATAPVPGLGFNPYPTNFNADNDCRILHNAVHGLGTDERAIINVIVNRNGLQRAEIRRRYKALYGKDLIKRLKEDTSGNFKDIVAGMFMTPSEYDATCLYNAMKGLGTNEGVLIEILATRTPQQIMLIKNAFRQKYNEDLEKWVKDDTSGNFRKLLIAILQCNRSMNPTPNPAMCQNDANALYSAGEGRWGTDESTFIRIFANRSPAELIMINDCYARLRGKGLLHAIEKEFSGDIRKLLETIVQASINLPAYFAKRIRNSVKGLGTNDSRLVRVIVSRSEIDLGLIKQAYHTSFHRDMLHDVRDDTSGYYKEILTGLIARC